jgi:hypothetical protein
MIKRYATSAKTTPPRSKKYFASSVCGATVRDCTARKLWRWTGAKYVRTTRAETSTHRKGTEKELATVEKRISEYMNELEKNDAAEADEAKLSREAVREILQRLNEKKDSLLDWLRQIEANGGKEISTVDPDAHIMHTGGDGRNLDACYNVQSVVDGKNKLIVDFDVSACPDDKGALPKMTEKILNNASGT